MTAIPVAAGELVGLDYLNGVTRAIRDTTLLSATATVNFTSIEQVYGHLELDVLCRSDGAASYLLLQFNGDTAANYNYAIGGTTAGGVFVGVAATGQTSMRIGYCLPSTAAANRFASTRIFITYYRGTTHCKQTTGTTREAAGSTLAVGGDWEKPTPEAITSILVKPDVGNFAIGTRVSLYAYGTPS
jgi:hypothetical protein